MKKLLYLLIFIFVFCLLPKTAEAGIIFKPVFHTGLVGYWDFQEGAGDKANDKSGKDNDGTLDSTMTQDDWVDGKMGKALDFDAADDDVNCGTDSMFDFSGTMTIAAWIYPRSTGEGGFGAIVARTPGGYTGYDFFVEYQSGSTCKLALWDGTEITTTNYAVTLNAWNHAVAVVNNNNVTFYVNGINKGGDAWSLDSSGTRNLYIGSYDGNASTFDGIIDEVRIYNRALSESEIQRLYKLSQPTVLSPTRTGLVGYWPFEENTDIKAGDHSGYGNNGTWSGTGSHWTDGKLGTAGNFNGSNDYVAMGDPANGSLDFGTSDFSLSAWVYTPTKDTSSNTYLIVGKWMYDEAVGGYALATRLGRYTMQLGVGGAGSCNILWYGSDNSQNDLVAGVWEHVVATFDRDGYVRLYVNGAESFSKDISSQSSCNVSNSFLFTVGARNDGGYQDGFYNGIIDEVRIYNRALETSEIQALYRSGLAKINASQNQKLTDGLVGLWSFNGPDIDGNEAYDRSGQNNHGTINGAVRTIGKLGQALDFDGSNDIVTVIDDPSLSPAGAITISAWIYPHSISTVNWQMVVGRWADSDNSYYLGIANDERLHLSLYTPEWDTATGNTTIVPYNWYHIVGTYDGANMVLYLNGANNGGKAQSGNINDSENNLTIGASTKSTSETYFDGIIDEVRIYNRALTAQEIQRLYNLGRQ